MKMALLTLLIGFGLGLIAAHVAIARADARIKGLIEDVCREEFELPDDVADGIVEEILDEIDPHAQAVRNPLPAPAAVTVDLNRIVEIESSGNTYEIGLAGERGLCQIMGPTWKDTVCEMGRSWPFTDAHLEGKNLQVARHYLTVTIPRYLRHYRLPDSLYMRLACYNWGIGKLKDHYARHGRDWFDHLPASPKDYIRKYRNAEPQQDYLTKYGVTTPTNHQ